MTVLNVHAGTTLEAWRIGAAKVIETGELNNLVTTITDPCVLDRAWLVQYSPRRVGRQYDDIRDVVHTVFPVDLAARSASRHDLYAKYLGRHDRATKWRRNRSKWGTYFERLVRFPPDGTNQLDRAIQKLRTWKVRSTTALVFHLSSPAIDSPRTRGGPCWQFGELVWNQDDRLDLVVVYRNHDFFNKTLGNFIGLGQLLKFVCDESGKRAGRLVCHSVHAYSGGSVTGLRKLADQQ